MANNKQIYTSPRCEVVEMAHEELMNNASVGGWDDGGSLGGGEAEEVTVKSRRGSWGNLWCNN